MHASVGRMHRITVRADFVSATVHIVAVALDKRLQEFESYKTRQGSTSDSPAFERYATFSGFVRPTTRKTAGSVSLSVCTLLKVTGRFQLDPDQAGICDAAYFINGCARY